MMITVEVELKPMVESVTEGPRVIVVVEDARVVVNVDVEVEVVSRATASKSTAVVLVKLPVVVATRPLS